MPGYTYIGKLKNSFICDERLSGNDIRVYLSLKKWDTWEGKVMIETMADEIGMSRQSFSKSAKLLESLKYIKIVKVSNWDCYKYQILNKAHVKKDDMDVKNINTDVKKVNTNDVKNINPISIPNNIPIKEVKEKTNTAAAGKASAKDKIPYKEILDYLNEKAKLPRGYKPSNGSNKFISARWGEGFTLEDFKSVVDNKVSEWYGDAKWGKFLRPETLFGNKFQSYLNQQAVKEVDAPGRCLNKGTT